MDAGVRLVAAVQFVGWRVIRILTLFLHNERIMQL